MTYFQFISTFAGRTAHEIQKDTTPALRLTVMETSNWETGSATTHPNQVEAMLARHRIEPPPDSRTRVKLPLRTTFPVKIIYESSAIKSASR
jgi:hypothetical protein